MEASTSSSLPQEVIEERRRQLKEISDFIDESTAFCQEILDKVGWTMDHLENKPLLETCPLNSSHRMSSASLPAHIERCKWAKEGYSREEQEEVAASEENSFFYENKKGLQAITLDAESQREIIFKVTGKSGGLFPRTMDRLDSEFSPAQRLAIHEAVMEKLRSNKAKEQEEIDLGLDLAQDDKKDAGEKPKSHMEVLAELRDYRRRRQSYRAKNVHITKRSKTDVMREMIETHMKFLEETSKPEGSEEMGDDGESQESSRSRMAQGRDRSYSREDGERRSYSRDDRDREGGRDRDRNRDRDRESEKSRHRRSREHSRSRDARDRSVSPSRHGKHSSKHKHKHRSKHRSRDKDY